MKLVIQIPCLNEEKSLPVTLKALPLPCPALWSQSYTTITDGATFMAPSVLFTLGENHEINTI